MSLLTVTGLTHGFGDRAIFNNVSFQLNRLDKIGLVGANGEGKSTFMNIITGKLMPDEGKVEWAKNVRVGYLDQHAVLEKGMTIQSVLASAFDFLYDMENQMNEIYAGLGDASPEEMDKLMAEAGTIQDLLTMHDFYMIDAKVEEVARALGLSELGLDKDVTELSGGQRGARGTAGAERRRKDHGVPYAHRGAGTGRGRGTDRRWPAGGTDLADPRVSGGVHGGGRFADGLRADVSDEGGDGCAGPADGAGGQRRGYAAAVRRAERQIRGTGRLGHGDGGEQGGQRPEHPEGNAAAGIRVFVRRREDPGEPGTAHSGGYGHPAAGRTDEQP